MIEGVIYKYTSPSGKVYIGQTTNERHRRATWFCTKYRYAGEAINRARAKYGPENFTYEVLYKKEFLNKELASIELDKWEIYFIGLYNSYNKGYNNSIGGCTSRGSKWSEEARERMSKQRKGKKQKRETIEKRRHSLKGIKHSKQAVEHRKHLLRNSGRFIKIGQYNLVGELVKVWSCAGEISDVLNIKYSNIIRAIKTNGKYKNFYWRIYDGNTTIVPKITYKNGRPVNQYSINGTYLQTFPSIIEAARFCGRKDTANIIACCKGKLKSSYGYTWKYKQ